MAPRHLPRDPRLPLLHDHRPADDPGDGRRPAGLRRRGRVPRERSCWRRGRPSSRTRSRCSGRSRSSAPRVRCSSSRPRDERSGARAGRAGRPRTARAGAAAIAAARRWRSSSLAALPTRPDTASRRRPAPIAHPRSRSSPRPGSRPSTGDGAADRRRPRGRPRGRGRGPPDTRPRARARRRAEPGSPSSGAASTRRAAGRRRRDLRAGPDPPPARARRRAGAAGRRRDAVRHEHDDDVRRPPAAAACARASPRRSCGRSRSSSTAAGTSSSASAATPGADDGRPRRPRLVHAHRRRIERRPRLPSRRVPVRAVRRRDGDDGRRRLLARLRPATAGSTSTPSTAMPERDIPNLGSGRRCRRAACSAT